MDRWSVRYVAILYQLQQLFSNDIYDRMFAFPEIERVVEEIVVASFKIFLDNRLEGLRKIAKHLRPARITDLRSYLALT